MCSWINKLNLKSNNSINLTVHRAYIDIYHMQQVKYTLQLCFTSNQYNRRLAFHFVKV